jgi:hypothetical protein
MTPTATSKHPLAYRNFFIPPVAYDWLTPLNEKLARAEGKGRPVNCLVTPCAFAENLPDEQKNQIVQGFTSSSMIEFLMRNYETDKEVINLLLIPSLAELVRLFDPPDAQSLSPLMVGRERSRGLRPLVDYLINQRWGIYAIAHSTPAVKIGNSSRSNSPDIDSQLSGLSIQTIHKFKPDAIYYIDTKTRPATYRTDETGFSCFSGIVLPKTFPATAAAFYEGWYKALKPTLPPRSRPSPPPVSLNPIAAVDTSDQPLIPE